jgi:hypothetical protein
MTTTVAQGYIFYEPDFYHHYQEHRGEHVDSYDKYRPAYRYGYDLGAHQRYGAGTWEQIALEACARWEARNPGTWEQFKGSIHYAWATASGRHEYIAPPMPQM